jgi:hypothetical protein
MSVVCPDLALPSSSGILRSCLELLALPPSTTELGKDPAAENVVNLSLVTETAQS